MTALRSTRTWQPSEEQEAVREAIAKRSGSVMVEAGAGCAKSSTLEFSAPGVRVPALALAFNKSIATELGRRLPPNFSAKTMNAVGHGAWGRSRPGLVFDMQPRKLGTLVSQVAKEWKAELTTDQWIGVRELVEKVMQWGLVPSDDEEFPDGGMTSDAPQTWLDAAAEVGLGEDPDNFLLDLAKNVLREDIRLARQGTISFDDQVYCSALLGGKFPAFPVLMVDENQDLSPLNHRVLGKCLAPGGRLITVGDRHQAVYGFRGASGASAAQIRRLVPEGDWSDRTLMTTYRCPQSVVARQQRHVPGYTAAPEAPEGLVHTFPSAEGPDGTPWGWQDLQGHLGVGRSLAVLCRNNAPLLQMAFRLIRRGVGVVMLGRDIGKGLVALCKKIAPQALPVDLFAGKLREWEERECALAEANGKPGNKAGIRDKADCLRAVLEGSTVRDSAALAKAVEAIFARESGLVTLSSIHRAKGLEWDVVLHLDPWRCQAGIRRCQAMGDLQGETQERNLVYVCETRTRHTFLMGSMEDFG